MFNLAAMSIDSTIEQIHTVHSFQILADGQRLLDFHFCFCFEVEVINSGRIMPQMIGKHGDYLKRQNERMEN